MVSFPRTVPAELSDYLTGMTMTLKPQIEMSPLRSGRQIAADLGPALWMGEWTSGPLSADRFGIVRAWVDTLLSTQAFYGFDKLREYPLAYKGGFTGGFTGLATLTSVTQPFTLALGTLPASFVMSPGDYLSFGYNSGANTALHRVVVGGTASGGGALTLEVRPAIRSGYAGGSVVRVYQAVAEMIIIPGSYSESVQAPDFGNVSFKAIQTL